VVNIILLIPYKYNIQFFNLIFTRYFAGFEGGGGSGGCVFTGPYSKISRKKSI